MPCLFTPMQTILSPHNTPALLLRVLKGVARPDPDRNLRHPPWLSNQAERYVDLPSLHFYDPSILPLGRCGRTPYSKYHHIW